MASTLINSLYEEISWLEKKVSDLEIENYRLASDKEYIEDKLKDAENLVKKLQQKFDDMSRDCIHYSICTELD